MTLPTSLVIFSTNALSLATSSFNARTSFMAFSGACADEEVETVKDREPPGDDRPPRPERDPLELAELEPQPHAEHQDAEDELRNAGPHVRVRPRGAPRRCPPSPRPRRRPRSPPTTSFPSSASAR